MDDFEPTQYAIESFHASNESKVGQARKWLWLSLAISIGAIAITSRSLSLFLIVFAVMILFLGGLDFVMRRQLKRGKSLVTLQNDTIESPGFPGKQKVFHWKDISSASIEIIGNAPVFQLQLQPSSGLADKRNFWTGRNQARPHLSLAAFSTADQERLLDSVLERLRSYNPAISTVNTLVQEREFLERLVALAPRTWVTYALVSINVAVWLLMLAQGADITRPSVEMLLHWGGNAASEVQRGQWWRMVSATFLHSGIMHLAMNMIGLWSIGQTVERIYGHRSYLMIYLGAGITGSALSLHFSAQKAVSVGASGAVFGIAGALLVAVYQHRDTLPKIFGKQNLTGMGFFVFYSLAQGFTHSGIDNGAHIGGLLAGCVMAYILPKRFDLQLYVTVIKHRSIAALATVIGLSAAIALSAPAAHIDMQRLFAGAAAFDRGVKRFEEASKLMQQFQGQVKSGRMTELDLDSKTRTVLAPAYRKVSADLSQAWFSAEDPRHEFLQELRRLTELLIEGLAMESVVLEGTSKISPADPARAEILNVETLKSAERLNALGTKLKMTAQNSKQ